MDTSSKNLLLPSPHHQPHINNNNSNNNNNSKLLDTSFGSASSSSPSKRSGIVRRIDVPPPTSTTISLGGSGANSSTTNQRGGSSASSTTSGRRNMMESPFAQSLKEHLRRSLTPSPHRTKPSVGGGGGVGADSVSKNYKTKPAVGGGVDEGSYGSGTSSPAHHLHIETRSLMTMATSASSATSSPKSQSKPAASSGVAATLQRTLSAASIAARLKAQRSPTRPDSLSSSSQQRGNNINDQNHQNSSTISSSSGMMIPNSGVIEDFYISGVDPIAMATSSTTTSSSTTKLLASLERPVERVADRFSSMTRRKRNSQVQTDPIDEMELLYLQMNLEDDAAAAGDELV